MALTLSASERVRFRRQPRQLGHLSTTSAADKYAHASGYGIYEVGALLDVACHDLFNLAEVSLAAFPEAPRPATVETRTLGSVRLPFQASDHAAYGPTS
jgi:hypothetical protein